MAPTLDIMTMANRGDQDLPTLPTKRGACLLLNSIPLRMRAWPTARVELLNVFRNAGTSPHQGGASGGWASERIQAGMLGSTTPCGAAPPLAIRRGTSYRKTKSVIRYGLSDSARMAPST